MTRHLHSKEFVEITCEVLLVTPRAVLLNDGVRDAWVPKSQIETRDEDLEQGKTLPVLMTQWIAKEKGFL